MRARVFLFGLELGLVEDSTGIFESPGVCVSKFPIELAVVVSQRVPQLD